MATRPPASEDRSSLLHPITGYAAGDVRRAVGGGREDRIARLEDGLERLRRMVAGLKGFRGLRPGQRGMVSTPDSSGLMDVYSPDESVDVGRTPNQQLHGVSLGVVLPDPENPCECCAEDAHPIFNSVGCPCITVTKVGMSGCQPIYAIDLDCDCIGVHIGVPH